MSSTTTHTCDRCGNSCNGDTYIKELRRNYKEYRLKNTVFYFEMCETCWKEFLDFIKIVDPKPVEKLPRRSYLRAFWG